MLSPIAADPVDLPRLSDGVAQLLERLLVLPDADRRVVSAYLRLDPRDGSRHGALIALKDQIRAVESDPGFLALGHDLRQEVGRDLERVLRWAERAIGQWPAEGLAVFAWEGGGLFDAVPLPEVERTLLVADSEPRIRELVAAEPDTKPVLAVLLDRAHVRMFEVSCFEVTELPGVFSPNTRGGKFHSQRGDAPGWGEHDFHGRRDEERRRQHAEIVAVLEPLARTRPFLGLVLAGPKDHTAALEADLPKPLAELFLGAVKLNPTAATPAEVQTAALAAARAARQRVAIQAVQEFKDALATGMAAEGIRETVRALEAGQARMLLVAAGSDGGDPQVEAAVGRAIRQRMPVMTVPPPESATLQDGLGALLRYR